LQPDIIEVNGEPALLLRAGSEVRIVLFISLDQGQVDQIWVVGNPDKLKEINRLLSDAEGVTE
jgi:hypothetical protein